MIVFRAQYTDKVTGEKRTTDRWYLRFEGKKYPLGTNNREVAERKAKKIIAEKEGGGDPRAEQQARRENLLAVIDLFVARLTSKACKAHCDRVRGRLRKVAQEVKAVELQQLTCEVCQDWLNASTLAARTRQHTRTHLRAFGSFLVASGRASRNPFAKLEPITGIEADRRLNRRALTDAEFAKLIGAVAGSQYTRLGVKPADRVWLYRLAVLTGFRRDELGVLTPESFLLDSPTPFVYLPAKNTKNKKEAHQPLPAGFAEELRAYLAAKPPGTVLWPISGKKTAERMIRPDLKEAGVPVEVAGRRVDFHSLRVTMGTNCALKQVPLALAQRLMRHSTPVLTANVYTVAQLSDLGREIEKLG